MGRVTVKANKVRNTRGVLAGGLYCEAEFKRFGGGEAVAKIRVPAADGAVLVFEDVPPGRYAAAVYHDENDNGRLDLNFVGVPAEGRGYSNTPKVGLGPPAFADAAFDHDEHSAVEVVLRYTTPGGTR